MKLEISRAHGLALSVIKQRLDGRVAHYAGRYPAFDIPTHYRWRSEHVVDGSYRGGSGTLTLSASVLTVKLDLPFFAWVYRSRIEEFIKSELQMITAEALVGTPP